MLRDEGFSTGWLTGAGRLALPLPQLRGSPHAVSPFPSAPASIRSRHAAQFERQRGRRPPLPRLRRGGEGRGEGRRDALREIDRFFKADHAVIIPLALREILDEHIARRLV